MIDTDLLKNKGIICTKEPAAASAGYDRFTPQWVGQQRDEWRAEPLPLDDLETYRINYDIAEWAGSPYRNHLPFGAALAIERLCCEIERMRSHITDCLNDNGHLADGEDCMLIDLKRACPWWESSRS